jgi:phage baseplate assembly protein W
MSRHLLAPLRINGTGGFAFTEDPGVVLQQALSTAIGTQQGERVMRPDYGSNLLGVLFSGDDEATRDEIMTEISDTAQRLVPEASVIDVDIQPDSDQAGNLVALIRYSQSNGTQDTAQVSFTNRSN